MYSVPGLTEDGTVGRLRLGTVGRDPCAADCRAGADLDDFLRLGVFRVVVGQTGDLVPDSLLARLVGPLDDDLKALVVLEQAGIKFRLDRARGRGAGKVWQADFLGDACVEFQHGMGS